MRAEHLPEEVIDGQRLGRHIEHDPRSKDHPFGIVLGFSSLKDVEHHRTGKLFNQGELSSCTGNATAGAVNSSPLHVVKKTLHEPDAVKIYERATQLDSFPGEYPPDDSGSSGLAAAKAAQEMGLITSYKHAFSLSEALSALQLAPVITGVQWYEGFDHPDASGLVKIAGQPRGGHEFVIRQFIKGTTLMNSILWADNSWGPAYGKVGRFCFTVKTWGALLADSGDATILLK